MAFLGSGTSDEPISFVDSEDESILMESTPLSRALKSESTARAKAPEHAFALDEDNDEEDNEDLEMLTEDEWLRMQRRRATAQSSHQIPPAHIHIRRATLFDGDIILEPGVGLRLISGDFFRVKFFTQNTTTGGVTMHGLRFTRNSRMDDQLDQKSGELCLLVIADASDTRPDLERGLDQCSVEDIDIGNGKLKRQIIITNQPLGTLRDFQYVGKKATHWRHWAEGILICRTKKIKTYKPNAKGTSVEFVEESFIHINQQESDENGEVAGVSARGKPDVAKVVRWLGNRANSGSSRPSFERSKRTTTTVSVETTTRQSKKKKRSYSDTVDEVEVETVARSRTEQRRIYRHKNERSSAQYSAMDLCCGAGGVSGGMEEAGLRVAVAVDNNHSAAETFRLNFPTATTYEADLAEFAVSDEAKLCEHCVVVHFSLPCQAFAHCHTIEGPNDEKNQDIQFVVHQMLLASRPMIVTFENTTGLKLISKHVQYYNILLKTLTDLGFNVRYKVADLSHYGNPQRRRRFLIIASCPGLPCPFFPAPTHGVELGLPAEVTVREAISGIDPNDPLHNPRELAEAYRLKPSKVLKPAEWDRPLGQLITTSGPLLLHPSGKRRFTTRECMRLNRFRDSHRLAACVKTKTDVHRLVGNAVPRDIVTLMSKSFIALLDEWMPMVEEYRSRNTIDFRYEDEDDDDAASVRAPKDNRRKASFKGRSNLGSLSRKMSKIDIEREEPEIVDRSSFVTSVPAEKRQRTLGDNFKVTKTAPPQSSVKREEARPGAFFDIVDLTKQ